MDFTTQPFSYTPASASTALERMKHVTEKVCLLWGQREFEVYVNRLIMDSRDGARQGLPLDAARELLFLADLSVAKRALKASEVTGVPFETMLAECLAQAQSIAPPLSIEAAPDPWADPRSNNAGRQGRAPAKPASSNPPREAEKKSWWLRLFG